MTRILDRSRPCGTIVGGSDGATYYQDGYHFRADGSCLEDGPIEAKTEEPAVEVVAETVEESGSASREDLEALHISQLKKLVAEAGLELETGPGSKARNIDNLLAAG